LKFANYLIKLNIATELKTYWSIDDRLNISEGGHRPPAPFLNPPLGSLGSASQPAKK